ncbi:hypothetical protein KIF24_30335 [Micromonospora sp. Llam7]|uniref:hypothetical protein n=1 Tax=Micromonospora tarapacensis TaxID=2835305 RepID=UPI001C83AEAE|nr:hypothetical protein [Micromonospora tarapacensis]MBX7269900.1 hypothetical protein [Micromonospora tarapacensis]
MSADLERMFSSLGTDSDRVALPMPDMVRTRGDRRRRVRAVGGLLAVALVVGGTAVGTRQLLADPAPSIPPIIDSTPSPTPSPSLSSSSAPVGASPEPTGNSETSEAPDRTTGSPRPGCDESPPFPDTTPTHAGQALNVSLMLTGADWGRCYVVIADGPGYPVYEPGRTGGAKPNVCLDDAGYDADADRLAGRFRHFDGGPEIGGFESVTRYRPGAASDFLDEIRQRVARCATFNNERMPEEWHALIVERNFAGDESLLIYVGSGEKGAGYPGWYLGVARRGDLVAVVEPHSDLGGSRDFARRMTRRAVDRL